jgi:hypothetical protein
VPQLIAFPHPSPAKPHETAAAAQSRGVQAPASGAPHWLATPAPPHVVPAGHAQVKVPPQPSP